MVLEKTLESPLDCKEIQPVHSTGDQSWVFFGRNDAEAETPILWPPYAKSWLIGKDSDAGRDWGQEEKGTTEDEMAGWHHRLNGREFEWSPGIGEGPGGLVCCNSWGCKESDMTEQLNWTELNWSYKTRWGAECYALRSPFLSHFLPYGAGCVSSLGLSFHICKTRRMDSKRSRVHFRDNILWFSVTWSEVKSLSCVRLFATPRTVAYQASPSMRFSRQEYWSGLPLPSQTINGTDMGTLRPEKLTSDSPDWCSVSTHAVT